MAKKKITVKVDNMNYFIGLPTGTVELLIDGEWQNIASIDCPSKDDIMRLVNTWSKKHKVEAARYNSHRYKNQIPVIVWER